VGCTLPPLRGFRTAPKGLSATCSVVIVWSRALRVCDNRHRVSPKSGESPETDRKPAPEELQNTSHGASGGKITAKSSVLLVVGRQDTGDLEAQVRGSRHAWTVRIISADALGKLVALKENTEIASAEKIHELLVPFEYTRLDRIIDIAFTVAEEASESEAADVESTGAEPASMPGRQRRTAADVIEQVRSQIVAALSKKYSPLVKKSKALYWSPDKAIRVAVTISKQYENGGFWYAHHPGWDAFLNEASEGFLVLGCIGRDAAYAIPHAWIHSRLHLLNATERENGSYWHILLHPENDGNLVLRLNNGRSEPLESFRLELRRAAA